MKTFFILAAIIFLQVSGIRCQSLNENPVLTLKMGVFASAIHGTDYRKYDLKRSTFYQPGISGGILYRKLAYIGISGSQYGLFRYKDSYGFERNIWAIEA